MAPARRTRPVLLSHASVAVVRRIQIRLARAVVVFSCTSVAAPTAPRFPALEAEKMTASHPLVLPRRTATVLVVVALCCGCSKDDPPGPADTTPTPVAGISGRDKTDWSNVYGDAPMEELVLERDGLRDYLVETAKPEFLKRFAAGEGTLLSKDGKFVLGSAAIDEVSAVRVRHVTHGGEVRKVILPPEDFPELYVAKSKLNWLEDRISALEDAEDTRKMTEMRAGK